ncbi:hypothetical protein [Variovorax sp. AFSI2.2]|uniref:hypothetical protein n=1 Tax=Variovorax sp. AFSI2.2 TaxID=3384160 RepID=UPI003EBA0686
MILFLDFDGVLHPEGEDHILNGGVDFCFLPRLEALLREFPFVKIVMLWTDFELTIETPEGLISDAGRAMKMATNLLNDYALIRTVDESAEPDTWRDKQGRKLQAADTLRIHQAQRAWLRDKLGEPFAGPTVVVTHHAPHRGSLAQRYADDWASGAFVNELPDIFFDVPVLWVHGHTHQQFDYRVRSCRVVCNPRGYVNWRGRIENKVFDPGLVIDVQPLAGGGDL